MTDKLNQEIKIKAKQVTEDLINFMQDLDTENNYQIKELQIDIKYYKSRIEELEKQIEMMKCCNNCKHRYFIDFKSVCAFDKSDMKDIENPITCKCNKWGIDMC